MQKIETQCKFDANINLIYLLSSRTSASAFGNSEKNGLLRNEIYHQLLRKGGLPLQARVPSRLPQEQVHNFSNQSNWQDYPPEAKHAPLELS
jgi:hypothetical protein